MVKRAFDVVASAVGLAVLSPVMALVVLAVRLDSPGPILYRAARVGQGGRLFTLYKFRSMVVNADKVGPGITATGDSRVTRIGRILRRTKLDELPQLFNVLRGDMSLVGPRPEDPRYVALYTTKQREVLNVRPGITSLASVKYRHEESILKGEDWKTRYIQDVMPTKLAIDLEYVENASLLQDFYVLWRTVFALFR
jgi:lipopolysaccharide/colanic/teichoic acid biosynthesis glycosyltransferase